MPPSFFLSSTGAAPAIPTAAIPAAPAWRNSRRLGFWGVVMAFFCLLGGSKSGRSFAEILEQPRSGTIPASVAPGIGSEHSGNLAREAA